MNKTIKNILGLVIITGIFSLGAYAESTETNLCMEKGVIFGFFNGVQTTKHQARIARGSLKSTFGDRTEDDEKIKYELFYNYTDGFEDFVETFEQRLKEQDAILGNRFELFFQVLHKEGSWWEKIIETIPALADILGAISDDLQASMVNTLTGWAANPPTIANYAEQQSRISTFILEGKKLLFFAHSQGNLFANSAYDYAVAKVGSDSVKVVHVAPASPTLRGSYTLANLDLVINGLRIAGSVPNITDTMPEYLLRSPGVNGETDILGHGLLEIYLNTTLPMITRIREHVNTAFNTLVSPETEASQGFFTVTLTWDGSGDVDLHTYEPDGSHVYYASPTGTSGYLDVDNTSANGPEHYFASCDESKLLLGDYRISIANFARAEGRTATLQIASWKEGVLSTKSVTLGEATGNNPVYTIFNATIEKDDETGEYNMKLEN